MRLSSFRHPVFLLVLSAFSWFALCLLIDYLFLS